MASRGVKHDMKTCRKCGVESDMDGFYVSTQNRDGRSNFCKVCDRLKSSNWTKANPKRRAAIAARWERKHPEKRAAQNRKWEKANPKQRKKLNAKWEAAHPEAHHESMSKARKKWDKANTGVVNAKTARHKAKKKQATPGWTNHVAVGEFYALAVIKTKLTGQKWEVDHIVPLDSPLVCGLHTHYNLQVLTKKANVIKGNRVWPDQP